MGRMVRVNGFSSVGVLGLAAILAVGTLLGGCSRVAKKDYEAAKDEASELRERNAQLDQQNRDLANRTSQLEANLAAAEAARVAPAPVPQNPQPGNWTDGNDGRGSPRPDTVYELAGDVTFASGQAELTSSAKKRLDGIASDLKRNYGSATIRVEGYSDSKPIKKSKWGSNEALSQARAESVERYLVSRGISSGRISSIGMGPSKLRSTDAASRRVEIHVTN